MSENQLHEFPGRQLMFESSSKKSPQDAAMSAIDGLGLFWQDFVTPLSADLMLSYWNSELNYSVDEPVPEQRFWFLKSEEAPENAELEPAWVNASERSVAAITSATMLEWILSAMAENTSPIQAGDNTLVIGWTELMIRATRVRLPHSTKLVAKDSLEIAYGSSIYEYPVEQIGGELFVSGPLKDKVLTAPIDLGSNTQIGPIKLEVSLHWSLWTDPQQAGWTDLRNGVQRLQQNGWKNTYSGINLQAM